MSLSLSHFPLFLMSLSLSHQGSVSAEDKNRDCFHETRFQHEHIFMNYDRPLKTQLSRVETDLKK